MPCPINRLKYYAAGVISWNEETRSPHRTRTFMVSNDKRFEEKFWDVVGLSLDPPEKALVLC